MKDRILNNIRTLFYSYVRMTGSQLVVLNSRNEECPEMKEEVMRSFRGVVESTRLFNQQEFILFNREVFIVKWKKGK